MRVTITPVVRPLKAWLSDVVGGHGHHTQFRRGIELSLQSDIGLVGVGEASPLPHFSCEHLEEVESEIAAMGNLDVELPSTLSTCRSWLDECVSRCNLQTPSARFAVEGALLDLFSQHLQLPAASLIARMVSRAVRSDGLTVSKLLPSGDQQRLLGSARSALARGYRTLKVKLGSIEDFDQNLRDLEVLRQKFGYEVKLRLDPNQSWPRAELPRLLAELVRLAPEFVEEPVQAKDLLNLEESPVPLALDESLREPGVLDTCAPHLARLSIRVVVIKPALIGLMRALDVAERAYGLGLEVVVTHLFDGPVGHATAASLALAVGTSRFAHGLAPHPGLLMSPELRVLGLGAGRLAPTEQVGHPVKAALTC